MTTQDAAQLTEIHLASWSGKELSMRLGPSVTAAFYRRIAESPHTLAYVVEVDGRIVAYSVGYLDYRAFRTQFLLKDGAHVFFTALKRFFSGQFTITDFKFMAKDDDKLRKVKHTKHQVGALALRPDLKGTDLGRQAITAAINAVTADFERRRAEGCWAVCDEENVSMAKTFLRLGFEKVDLVAMGGRSALVFEKVFG